MWKVELHPEVRVWIRAQDFKTQQNFANALDLLMWHGPHLGRPLVDTIVGSKIKNSNSRREI